MIHKLQAKTQILSSIKNCDETIIVQPLRVGQTEKENELLMFIKPEVFEVDNLDQVDNFLNLTFDKLDEFEAEVNGIVIVGGKPLEQKQSMDRHYGAINVLSRSASHILSEQEQGKIYELLNVPLSEYPILGGHEFLKTHSLFNPFSLDDFWRTKKSVKIRSGFYVQSYEMASEKFILVNGFHPVQLAHFTDSTHRIVMLLIHSNTKWSILRTQMIGDTFPDRADIGSIRGGLYANPSLYGFEKVSISNNGVHLSAGPFEAMFEINNFFGSLLDLDMKQQKPVILKRMLASGISIEQATNAIENPIVASDEKSSDLFSMTEHLDTEMAVALYKRFLNV